MSLSAVPALPSRERGVLPSLDALLGKRADGPADVAADSARALAYRRFASGDKSFGRYSRLKLDWAGLAPAAPRFEPLDLSAWGSWGGGESAPDVLSKLADDDHAKDFRTQPSRFRASSPWDDLVLAGWRDGLSLRWPAGKSGGPVGFQSTNPGGLVLEPILIDVEPGAEACLFIRWDGSERPSLHLTSLQGRVAEGARLKLFLLHQGLGTHHRISSALDLGRDASVEVFCAWLGGKWTVARMGAELSEPGSSWRETHLISTGGKEHLDLDSQVRLAAKHTYSDIQVKAVADGNSRAIFTGNLLMEPAAVQSEAYLADHVLLLSENARADSIPGLEIKAADVKASHAASVGQVDEEQLFYLESRGLAPAEARSLIVVGFLRSLMERAPLPFVQEILDPLLETKVSL